MQFRKVPVLGLVCVVFWFGGCVRVFFGLFIATLLWRVACEQHFVLRTSLGIALSHWVVLSLMPERGLAAPSPYPSPVYG